MIRRGRRIIDDGAVDEAGRRYGNLLVLRRLQGDYTGAWWLVRCLARNEAGAVCGKELEVSANNLRLNHSRSCGCAQRRQRGLTADEVREIREARAGGATCAALARQYQVTASLISLIARGMSHAAAPGPIQPTATRKLRKQRKAKSESPMEAK